jgi:hypothetical protein
MAKKSGRWCCYILHFVTDRGVERTYYGTTELCRGQTATEACEVRMETHQTRPLKWMRKAIRKSMSIVPLVTLSEKNAATAREEVHASARLAVMKVCSLEPKCQKNWFRNQPPKTAQNLGSFSGTNVPLLHCSGAAAFLIEDTNAPTAV